MSCEAITDLRESILDTKMFANMLQNETSSSIQADLLSSCNSFRTADQRWRALTQWPKWEDTSWHLDSLMSRLVSWQQRRNSSLSLIRPERIQRRSRRRRRHLAIVASADSGGRRRREQRTRRVLARQIASRADVATRSSWSAKLSTSVSCDMKSSDDNNFCYSLCIDYMLTLGYGALSMTISVCSAYYYYYYLFRTKQCNNQAQTIMQRKLKK